MSFLIEILKAQNDSIIATLIWLKRLLLELLDGLLLPFDSRDVESRENIFCF